MNNEHEQSVLHAILRRESRSLFQYLREVPPWSGPREQNLVARLCEFAKSEIIEAEALGRLLQKRHCDSGLSSFPDFTPFNDAALHFLLPAVIREQKGLLGELERDRHDIGDDEAGPLLDRLIGLKRRHIAELEALHVPPHTFTTMNA